MTLSYTDTFDSWKLLIMISEDICDKNIRNKRTLLPDGGACW